MCKFKKGDKVVIVKPMDGNPEVLKKGVTGIVLDLHIAPFIQFDVDKSDSLHDALGEGDVGKCYSMTEDELELYNEYKQSNRHKLHQAIKATGFHAEKLSLATGKAKNYFVGITAESRFIKHGDITEERLNSLLTTLAFAERELLGVGAKTVGDQVKPEGFGGRSENHELSFKDYPLYDSTVDYSADDNESVKDLFKNAPSNATHHIVNNGDKVYFAVNLVETKKPKLSNFTKVGIIAIVILLLILWFTTR